MSYRLGPPPAYDRSNPAADGHAAHRVGNREQILRPLLLERRVVSSGGRGGRNGSRRHDDFVNPVSELARIVLGFLFRHAN